MLELKMNDKEKHKQRFNEFLFGLPEKEYGEFIGDLLDWTSSIAQAHEHAEFARMWGELFPNSPRSPEERILWDTIWDLTSSLARERGITIDAVFDSIFQKKDCVELLQHLQKLCFRHQSLMQGMDYSLQIDMHNLSVALAAKQGKPN